MLKRLNTIVALDERRLVVLLLLLSFALGVALVFIDVASRALFLERFPADQLPYAYLSSALVIPVIGIIFGRLQGRISFSRLAIGMVALLLLLLAALWASIVIAGLSWPLFVLVVWYRLYYAFNGLLFWGLAGQIFTLRQGKRLFGLVGTGESIAGVLGYFSASLIAGRLGTQSMLLIAVGGMLLAIVILLQIERVGAAAPDQGPPAPLAPDRARRDGSRRYVLLIITIAVATIITYIFADYAFSAESGQAIKGADALAGFFGLFFGGVAVLRIAFRSAVSGWLLRRFGLRAGLLLLPITLALGTLTLIAVAPLGLAGAVFVMITITRFAGSVLQASIQRSSVQVLYQPLEKRRRLSVQSLVEGVIEPAAIGAGSLLLLGLRSIGGLSTPMVAALILVITLAWVVVALRLMGDYRDTLGRALARRLLEGSALDLSDASSRQVLERTLDSRHPGEVIYALGLLERADPTLLAERLPGLLDHPDPRVRREAVARLGRADDLALRPVLAAAYDHERDPDVRARMVRSLDGSVDARAAALIDRARRDPAPQVRDAALLHDLRADGRGDQDGERLRAMIAAGDAGERARAARIIGRLGDSAWSAALIGLFADADAEVRREALRAAGRSAGAPGLEALIAALARPETRGPAAMALARRGEPALPAIAAALGRPDIAPALMARLLRICGRVRGPAAVELLASYLDHPTADVRHAAITALRRCGFRATAGAAQRARAQIRVEVGHALRAQMARQAAPDDADAQLLRAALDARLGWLRQVIFALLELIADPRSIRRIELNLFSPSPQKRDYAYELLDLHVDAELRQLILPALTAPAAAPAEAWASWLPRLVGAAEPWVTPWIGACALACARHQRGPDLDALVMLARASASPLVGETADWAAGEPVAAGLATIEKVQILSAVGIFGATDGEILAEVAGLLSPVVLPGGGPIFHRGERGDSMYIIVRGAVRIHDGSHTVAQLGPGEVFGEMAVLDAEPRSASAEALGPTLLLRLDQEPFYELMDDRIEVAQGVIRVLNRRLRASVRDLAAARAAMA